MSYDLIAIEDFCRSEGMRFQRASPDEIRVRVCEETDLIIANTEAGSDTYLGFSDGSWHTHGVMVVMTGPNTALELDPIEVLIGLRIGDLLICSQYLDGALKDRWIFHRKDKQDFQYFGAGESMSIQRADLGDTANPGASHLGV